MVTETKRLVKCFSLLACFAIAIAGCSGPAKPAVGSAKGKVTLGGAPFGEGRIVFKDLTTSIEAVAELKPDGTFEVITPEGGLRVGKCDVSIQPPPPAEVDPIEAAKNEGAAAPPDASKIPQIYRAFATSGFKATVVEGKNTFDFDMKP